MIDLATNWSTPVDRVDNVKFVMIRGRRWSARKLVRNIGWLVCDIGELCWKLISILALIVGCAIPFVYLFGGFNR